MARALMAPKQARRRSKNNHKVSWVGGLLKLQTHFYFSYKTYLLPCDYMLNPVIYIHTLVNKYTNRNQKAYFLNTHFKLFTRTFFYFTQAYLHFTVYYA